MKNQGNAGRPFLKEACSAICVIAHANINDSQSFNQSSMRKRTKISSLGKICFHDQGVIVSQDDGKIHIRLHVTFIPGLSSLYESVVELQTRIKQEVLLLTGLEIKTIDIAVTGVLKSE